MTAGATGWVNGTLPVVAPEQFASLLAATSDFAFLVSESGEILSAIASDRLKAGRSLDQWVGHPMSDHLTVESVPKFEGAVRAVSAGEPFAKLVELNHVDGADWQYPVQYSFHKAGPQNSVLMLGRDLSAVAETQEQLVQAQIALERGYEERRENDALYRVLMAATWEAFLFVSSDGRIRDVNAAASRLLDSDAEQLIGKPLAKVFRHRRGAFVETLLNAAASDHESDLIVQSAQTHRDLILSPSVFRAAGDRLILCRLSAPGAERPADEELREDLDVLYRKITDAIVFCDKKGIITDANEAFLELADIPNMSDVVSRNLAEFLHRGQVDLAIILDNTARAGRMRTYSTRLSNGLGAQATVEIAAVALGEASPNAFAFLIRDADRAMAVRKATQPANSLEAPNLNVAALVGSATLKEIVAETSDVIEKMCVEAAVELTRNNRAAAAEMLGVSRQSLYVKLRKYGILKRDDD